MGVTTVPSLRVGGGVGLHIKRAGTGADKGPDSQVIQQLVPLLWTQIVVWGRDVVISIPLGNPKTCRIKHQFPTENENLNSNLNNETKIMNIHTSQ